jgi:hypothetical protein
MGTHYTTGKEIPQSGIYRVIHKQHRLPHQVTLMKGEIFPRCLKCGDLVEFELIQPVDSEHPRTSDSVRLYALPDLDDEQSKNPLRLAIP